MTIVVGLALLLVFAVFATLMFLERISTLLALPLMATAFLLVALAADVGRASGSREADNHFVAWRQAQESVRELYCARRFRMDNVIEAIRAFAPYRDKLGSASILRELDQLEADESAALKAEANALDELPDYFAKPPLVSGFKARARETLASVRVAQTIAAARVALQREAGAAELDAIALAARREHSWAPRAAASRLTAIRDYFAGYIELLLRGGSLTLYATIIATIFGGMFAVYVKNLGIAERVIYWTAEFAGERPFVIASAVFIATATIFTSVGGLGTVIMIGSIVLPVLRSVGLSPVVGAGVLLIGIAAGGTLNPVSRRLWMDFYGLSADELDPLLWTMLLIYALLGFGWIAWGARSGLLSSFDSEATAKAPPRESIGVALLLAPIIPVGLVYFARMEEISAFVVSIAYMFLCACRRPGAVRVLTRSMIEGAQTVMPPVLLMIGIGMLVTSLATPPVQSYLRPLIEQAAPEGRLGYIVLFGLAAPLALYRGPLNVWGMGLAVSATLLTTTSLPPAAVLGALLAAGMIQGISDPTNTANVWVAGYSGITTAQLLRFTLVPVWIAAITAVVVFGMWYVG